MDRLTNTAWRNFDPWECCGQDNYCTRGCHDKGGCANGCIVPKLYGRLAEFEDAEWDGRLVVLPCKVGDTVWAIDERFCGRGMERLPILKCRVNEFSINRGNAYIILDGAETWFAVRRFKAVKMNDFGKTVFLTREEAEKALKGGEE